MRLMKRKRFFVVAFCGFMTMPCLSVVVCAQSIDTNVDLNLTEVTLSQFLGEIKKQTGLDFIYQETPGRNMPAVTVHGEGVSVKNVLDSELAKAGCTYEVDGNIVTIKSLRIRKMSGVVKDEKGHSLPGVTILVKGTKYGTVTNENGVYNLSVPQTPCKVSFTCIGMSSQDFNIRAGTEELQRNVTLYDNTNMINEVVVTGYHNISKKSFTGTSVTVSSDQLMSVSKTNVLEALQVFDPSFRIAENNQAGSNPNKVPELYIRGRSGIGTTQLNVESVSKTALSNNPNLPTFIMDGFEISVQKLYDMDPSRIASITILKDAAATALYGSRAANGVVIITTVTPKPGKVNVSYNFTGTVEYPDLTDYNLMDAREKLQTEVAAGMYRHDPTDSNSASQNSLDELYNKKLENVVKGVNTYWLAQPLRTVFNQKHSINLDGGTPDLRWGVDLSYNTGQGVMKGSYRDRMAGGLSLSYKLGSVQIRNYFSYTYTKSQESPYGSFSDYTTQLPYNEFKDATGAYLKTLYPWNGGSGDSNPLYEATLGSYNRIKNWELINNTELIWNITPNLLLKGQFSVTKTNSDGKTSWIHSPEIIPTRLI